MKKHFSLFLIFLIVTTIHCWGSDKWGQMTQQDLKEVYQILKENSPIPYDTENPAYGEWLEEGYQEASKWVPQVDNFASYIAVLKYYIRGFYDSHIRVEPYLENVNVFWPQFAVSYEDGKFIVTYVEDSFKENPNAPQVGDEVIEIDGTPVKDYVLKYQAKFVEGAPELEATWIQYASALFLDQKIPFLPPPSTCKLSTKKIDLQWKEIGYCQFKEINREIQSVEKVDIGWSPFLDSKGVWISLPTFYLTTDDEVKQMQSVIQEMPSFRNKEVIVFDVRGNTGGSSFWGMELLEKLYGEEYVSQKFQELYVDQYTEFRVSPGNLSYLKELLPDFIEKHGEQSNPVEFVKYIIDRMEDALSKGDVKLITLKGEDEPNNQEMVPIDPHFRGTVYFVTDKSCNSACLDFADQLLVMPDVIHVGRSTKADTGYLEVRTVDLSSKNAAVTVPMKVTRNRIRKDNQPYKPTHRFPGKIKETEELKRWIKTLNTMTHNRDPELAANLSHQAMTSLQEVDSSYHQIKSLCDFIKMS